MQYSNLRNVTSKKRNQLTMRQWGAMTCFNTKLYKYKQNLLCIHENICRHKDISRNLGARILQLIYKQYLRTCSQVHTPLKLNSSLDC